MSELIRGTHYYLLKSFVESVTQSIGETKGRKAFTGIAVREHALGKLEKIQV